MPPSRSASRWSTGKWIAAILAVAVHLAFVVFLVFSVTWQNRKPDPVSVELYAAAAPEPTKAAPRPPEPEPPKPPPPQPQPEPPKPPPKVEPPQPSPAEIALKEKQELEQKKKEQAEREKKEKEKREAEKHEAEKREAEKRKVEEKHLAEARDRQAREADALKALAERERRATAQAAELKANDDYIRKIQAKVRGGVVVPPDIAGNPEAIFDIVQLPTGEIIEVQLRKSSGVRTYDEAVQRAIIKASPLPRPDSADLFRRNLTLKFRPQD